MYPIPLGNLIRITSFVDACLGYCKVTGKSITSIIHLLQQTPIKYFCKLQNTIETTTYGSEFIVAKQCAEQVRELQETLKFMGIFIKESTWMLGDNSSINISSTIPSSMLKKRYQALSYHYVHTCVIHGFLKFCFLKSEQNGAEIYTKFLPFEKF